MEPPKNKTEDFKDNGLTVVSRKLSDLFGELAQGTDLNAQDIERIVLNAPGEAARAKQNDEMMSAGSIAGMTPLSGQFSEHQRKLLERLKNQGRSDNAFNILLLDALQNNTLPSFIADQVFDDMSDDDVTALVADIEEQTGRPFEAYAKDILGDDLPERIAGESEADYQRRVLKDLTAEMLNPDGSVKPEYADDPIVQFLEQQDVVHEIRQKAQSIQAEVEVTGVTEKVVADTKDVSSAGYRVADTVSNGLENDELQNVASDGQNGHRDGGFENDLNTSGSSSALADIFGSSALGAAPSDTVVEIKSEHDQDGPKPTDTPSPI